MSFTARPARRLAPRRAGADRGLLGRWPGPRAGRSPRHQRGGRHVRRHHQRGDVLAARHDVGADDHGGSDHDGGADHHDHLGAAGGRTGGRSMDRLHRDPETVRFDTETKDFAAELDLAGTGCIG